MPVVANKYSAIIMNTITQITPSTLGEILEPLSTFLRTDAGISMDPTEYISNLPPVDPTTGAIYYLFTDYATPIPARLLQLVEITGYHQDDPERILEGLELVPESLRGPIRFSVLEQTVCLDSECTEEQYLLATMQPGMKADLADAERQVALLIEHFTTGTLRHAGGHQ